MPALIEPPSTGRDLLAEMTALGREVRRQVGTVNHEIRTPLAVISGSVQSVRRALPQDADKGRRSAELIAMSCERLVDILDKYRDETSSLVDTFLGTEVLIDVGAFVQDFVVHSGIAHRVTVSHPPHTVRAHTQTANLKEVLNQLLLEVDRGAKSTARISVQSAGAWACIIVSYEGNDVDGTRPEALPGIEFALRSQRARLGLMGAMLHRTIDAGGRMTLLLALPAGA
jgi:signal transduction histidine kinase